MRFWLDERAAAGTRSGQFLSKSPEFPRYDPPPLLRTITISGIPFTVRSAHTPSEVGGRPDGVRLRGTGDTPGKSEQAATYDSRNEKLLERMTAELRSRLDFIGVDWDDEDEDDDDDQGEDGGNGDSAGPKDAQAQAEKKKKKEQVRLLDYACGTGMMSRALAPYVTQCVGIDLSENMVAAYNTRARNQGLSPDEMHAVVGNFADPDRPDVLPGPEFRDFNLAAVGGGFHHFVDPELAAVRLVERLRPGGVLLIWDFKPQGHSHGHGEGCGRGRGGEDEGEGDGDGRFVGPAHYAITHNGFTEERIKAIYEKAGAGTNFRLAELGTGFIARGGHDARDREMARRSVFLARGEKAA
ncbi:hypothetical protein DL766_005670 [Monosporascus sp. MC13-8B]|uniref:Methyltransferase type 11 domain-containing protein n=1 Tax=Monosporascus cannonballus TaxID=155416 RepID=A0ABY0H8A1_9PEZI|nr:hypothetical protein DL762_005370 [Monosporascus cannonballus]RYO86842.1 hypothetical protein DL763_006550 [Monosporascus cannonballus]RYP28839.1 hypothetical protein DL766_005670 [Monosporascus sp. MC13-8B]